MEEILVVQFYCIVYFVSLSFLFDVNLGTLTYEKFFIRYVNNFSLYCSRFLLISIWTKLIIFFCRYEKEKKEYSKCSNGTMTSIHSFQTIFLFRSRILTFLTFIDMSLDSKICYVRWNLVANPVSMVSNYAVNLFIFQLFASHAVG